MNFSKVTFIAEGAAGSLDVEDPQFWVKVLLLYTASAAPLSPPLASPVVRC